MKDPRKFCTCTDTKCPCHPVNHDQGCNLCILKNLTRKEIPSCFFHSIDHEKPTKDWFYEDFAALVEAAKADKKQLTKFDNGQSFSKGLEDDRLS